MCSRLVILAVLMWAGAASANINQIILSGGNDQVRYGCFNSFGVSTDDDDVFDICLAGVVTGLIFLIAFYPFFNELTGDLVNRNDYTFRVREDNNEVPHHQFAQPPVHFRNPAESLPGQTSSPLSMKRFANALRKMSKYWRGLGSRLRRPQHQPYPYHHQEQPAPHDHHHHHHVHQDQPAQPVEFARPVVQERIDNDADETLVVVKSVEVSKEEKIEKKAAPAVTKTETTKNEKEPEYEQ